MTDEEYLRRVLKSQQLTDDSAEVKELGRHHKDVAALLKKKFGDGPTMREGGSKAKGTMNRESYDLDLPYYFPRDDDSAGETLREIYESVEKELQTKYRTMRKGVAVRLLDCDNDEDFYVDVVPGRFIDGDDGDAFLHPAGSDKERLQTNLDVHIKHVKDSGVVDPIRLQKLWRVRRAIGIKVFAIELLTIDLLSQSKRKSLPDQMKHVWTEFRDHSDDLTIADPANSGNDLSDMLSDDVRRQLREHAKITLEQLEKDGWEAVFGEVEGESEDEEKKASALRRVAAASPGASKPWCRGA